MFLDEKIERAVKILKENEPPEGYFVAFSGGKDSIVVYDIVKKANVKKVNKETALMEINQTTERGW
jgi:phosphoadenosine phosphosulfate reductase